jgi:putative endonuclease
MKWFVYIVKSKKSSLYTGITTDLTRRVGEHNGKRGSKSLLGILPVALVYFEEYASRGEASKREYEIKSWPRHKKLQIIAGGLR